MKVVKIYSNHSSADEPRPNVFHALFFNVEAGISNYNPTPHSTYHEARKFSIEKIQEINSSYTSFIIIEVDPN